mgnify:CR=1 FL=1
MGDRGDCCEGGSDRGDEVSERLLPCFSTQSHALEIDSIVGCAKYSRKVGKTSFSCMTEMGGAGKKRPGVSSSA